MPCSRRGKPRHISINARRFQGEWEALWTQVLQHNIREVDHRAKKLDGKPPAPASLRARGRYAEYCALKGALSKANQAMTGSAPFCCPHQHQRAACQGSRSHPPRQGPHHTTGIAYLASEGRHPCVVVGRRWAGAHSTALQSQAHLQVLQDQLPGVRGGHRRVERSRNERPCSREKTKNSIAQQIHAAHHGRRQQRLHHICMPCMRT